MNQSYDKQHGVNQSPDTIAMGRAWSMDATDRKILERIADLINDYTTKHYELAIGSSTGLWFACLTVKGGIQ